jgi:transposase
MSVLNRTINFSGHTFYIGIDVHRRKWVITIRNNQIELKTFSMDPSPEILYRYMQKNYPGGRYISAYEAGYFGFWIHRKLERFGFENIVVNAADIPTSHKEKTTKCDRIDSRKIARELENNSLRGIHIPDEFHQQLRSLCRLRSRYVQNQTRIKNRIKGHLSSYGIQLPQNKELSHWSGNFINWLRGLSFYHASARDYLDYCLEDLISERKKIAGVTNLLRRYIKENGQSGLLHQLISIPGFAFITAITFYTEIMDIRRFPGIDHICSYVGLVPSVHSSGEKESEAGLSPRKNRYLRHLIVESAWVAIRKDPALLLCFHEYCQRMKKQEAIIRIAKKLLNRMCHVWKNDASYVYSVVA